MRDLYIWAETHPVDLTLIRQAKAEMTLDFQVRPVAVHEPADMPWWPADRVLAIGTRPPFLCDYILIAEYAEDLTDWTRALRWVLGVQDDDDAATTIADTLTAAFGPGTREVPPEEIEGMERLRDYMQNRV